VIEVAPMMMMPVMGDGTGMMVLAPYSMLFIIHGPVNKNS